jgi:glutathione-regulated potassium-efflux system ancillary protein KefC/glutathione-regulated potassium-efflux system protein KefB
VLAIDDVEASMRTATLVRKHYPHLPILLARARNRAHYYRLRDVDLAAEVVERETFLSSLETALRNWEWSRCAQPEDAQRLDAQYAVHQDEGLLIQTAQQAAEQLQELFESDLQEGGSAAPAR